MSVEAPQNGVGTTIGVGGITSTQLTCPLTSATGFTNGRYRCEISDGINTEIIMASGLSGTTLTIARAVEPFNGSQTAHAFLAGATIQIVHTPRSVIALSNNPFMRRGQLPISPFDGIPQVQPPSSGLTFTGNFTKIALQPGNAANQIIVMRDGNVWVADGGTGHGITKVVNSGGIFTVTNYAMSTAQIEGICQGPDGLIYAADQVTNNGFWTCTLGGTVTQYTITGAKLQSAIAGPDGNIYFTDATTGNGVWVVNPATPTSHAQIAISGAVLVGACLGPDGYIWVCNIGTAGGMFKIDPWTQAVTAYPLGAQPISFNALGPDGNIWATTYQGTVSALVIDSTTGVQLKAVATVSPVGFNNIAPGPDGRVWYTKYINGSTGAISAFDVQTYAYTDYSFSIIDPGGVCFGTDGYMYVSDYDFGSGTGALYAAPFITQPSSVGLSQATIAAAGTAQGTATGAYGQYNVVSGATATTSGGSGAGVILPPIVAGPNAQYVTVKNTDTTHWLLVYPNGTNTIDAASASAAIWVAPGQFWSAMAYGTTWRTADASVVPGGPITVTPGNGQTTVGLILGAAATVPRVNPGATSLEYGLQAPTTLPTALQSLTASSDNILTGGVVAFSAGDIAVGFCVEWDVQLLKTGAGVTTWSMTARIGTTAGGTTTDTAVATWTSGTNTAAIDQSHVRVVARCTSIAAGVATFACAAFAQNELTSATGLGLFASPIPGSTATVTVATAQSIHLDVTPGASAVMTAATFVKRLG